MAAEVREHADHVAARDTLSRLGNDSLSLAGNLVTSTAALDGGTGGDALSLSANAFASLFTSNF